MVGIEVASCAIGTAVLSWRARSELWSVWIALVVGIHFVPLASLLAYPLLYVLAAVIVVMAVGSIPVARAQQLAVSAVTGVGTGSALLGAALFSLASVLAQIRTGHGA